MGLAPSSVLREVDRLARAGIVDTERIGNVRRVRANRDSRFYPELRGLVLKAFGPVSVLGAGLSRVPKVASAYIFGSWARYHLSPGTMQEPPRDIDVLVVGDPDPDRIYRACAAAEEELGLEVTPVIVDAATWSGAGHSSAPGFLETMRAANLCRWISVGARTGEPRASMTSSRARRLERVTADPAVPACDSRRRGDTFARPRGRGRRPRCRLCPALRRCP